MITKTPDGKLVWLETGNASSGLEHIIAGHAGQLFAKGIEIDDIADTLYKIMQTEPISITTDHRGMLARYMVDGNTFGVAYGTNGYIVSFFPDS